MGVADLSQAHQKVTKKKMNSKSDVREPGLAPATTAVSVCDKSNSKRYIAHPTPTLSALLNKHM